MKIEKSSALARRWMRRTNVTWWMENFERIKILRKWVHEPMDCFTNVDFDFLHVRIRIAQQLHKTATKFISSCCFDKQCTITGDLLDITISQKKKTIVGLSVLSLFSPESIMCSEMFTYQMRYDIRYVWVYSMSTQYTHFSPFIAFFLKVIHYESQWTGQVGKMEIN